MENTTNITSKNIKKKYCEKCDFRCFKKGDFNRHLNSKKHNTTNTTKIQPKILHHCECGKKYAHRASLFSLLGYFNNFSGNFLLSFILHKCIIFVSKMLKHNTLYNKLIYS